MTEIGRFLDGCKRLWRRYLKLGACLLVVYGLTAAVYVGFIVGGYALVDNSGILLGWGMAAAVALSVDAGVAVHLTVENLQGEPRLLAFAAVSLLAVGVLTWMIF